ncbi:fimbria/pilus periplasmic chaperone, partial [Providencia rettgeri]
MTGTRIIYNEGSDEKSVRLTNLARIPYAVQVWVDNDLTKDIATDETSDFIVTPQVFKIEPNTGQMVKIIKLANNLPNDVESLYYFNFSQIPATTEENSNQSQLSILFTSRMKLFYRPKSLLNEPN